MLNWGRPLTPLARQDMLPTTGASQSIIPHAQLMSTAIPEAYTALYPVPVLSPSPRTYAFILTPLCPIRPQTALAEHPIITHAFQTLTKLNWRLRLLVTISMCQKPGNSTWLRQLL